MSFLPACLYACAHTHALLLLSLTQLLENPAWPPGEGPRILPVALVEGGDPGLSQALSAYLRVLIPSPITPTRDSEG